MTKTIEQLTARVRELDEENARLKAECDDIKQVQFPRKLDAVATGWKKRLAAEQLNNKLLREALNQWRGIAANCSIESGWCCCGDSIENHSHPMACGHSPVDMADSVVREAIDSTDKALSLPASTEALDAYVAEKVKDARRTAEYWKENHLAGNVQIATLTRQRDLAVEAASDAATSLETIQLRSFGEESYLDSKPQMRAFAGARAKIARDIISTIKESEAMVQGETP